MSYFSRAATTIWHWTCWLGVTLFLVCASLLVTPVLAVWLALGFFPKRKSKPLTSQPLHRRKLPLIYREGSDIFAQMPDGSVVALEPMEAMLYAEDCFSVIAGGFVYEKTRIKLDESD